MNNTLILPGFPEPRKKTPKKGKKPRFDGVALTPDGKYTKEFNDFLIEQRFPAKKRAGKNENAIPFEPFPQMLSLNPDYFTIYNDISKFRDRQKAANVEYKKPSVVQDMNTGTFSRSALSRMKRSCAYLFLISKPKKVFHPVKKYHFTMRTNIITLTLSDKQKHSDHFVKQVMLKNFFDTLLNRYPGMSYVWKAEAQVENTDNIHFHIITDHFIPFNYVSRVWNRIQKRHGYLDAYAEKKKSYNAPSTEVEKVKSEKQMARYIRKYMLKGVAKDAAEKLQQKQNELVQKISAEKNPFNKRRLHNELFKVNADLKLAKARRIKGKLWGCSDNLLIGAFTFCIDELPIDFRKGLQLHQKVDIDSPFFSVFKLQDFSLFLKSFLCSEAVPHLHGSMVDFYKDLRKPDNPPDMVYDLTKNYRYKKAA